MIKATANNALRAIAIGMQHQSQGPERPTIQHTGYRGPCVTQSSDTQQPVLFKSNRSPMDRHTGITNKGTPPPVRSSDSTENSISSGDKRINETVLSKLNDSKPIDYNGGLKKQLNTAVRLAQKGLDIDGEKVRKAIENNTELAKHAVKLSSSDIEEAFVEAGKKQVLAAIAQEAKALLSAPGEAAKKIKNGCKNLSDASSVTEGKKQEVREAAQDRMTSEIKQGAVNLAGVHAISRSLAYGAKVVGQNTLAGRVAQAGILGNQALSGVGVVHAVSDGIKSLETLEKEAPGFTDRFMKELKAKSMET